ncbi:MAG TPA: SET domain-containing protein [Pseudolabrys sp.]|nr:SET domain-containing protein [Pseudolabrys sp.]
MAGTAKKKSGNGFYRIGRSDIGLGLFAARPIAERALIVEYSGRRIPTKMAQAFDRRRGNKYLFEIDRRWTIDGRTRTNMARYVNHSCDPNAEAESNRGRLMYRAIKDIAEDEEITVDYGEEHMALYFGNGCLCPLCKPTKAKAKRTKKTAR